MQEHCSIIIVMEYKHKDTHVENFKTSNIQYTNEMLTFLLCVQSFVTFFNHELEKSVKHTLRHSTYGI